MRQPITTYTHGGGLFSFDLPADWSHEVESGGTQVFWHPSSGSGTLRVSSLTSHKVCDPQTLPASAVLKKNSEVSFRLDGVAWTHYRVSSSTEGEETVMFWWELAQFLEPKYFRIAFFSFTIFSHEEQDERTRAMLRHLSAHLPETKFGPLQAFEHG